MPRLSATPASLVLLALGGAALLGLPLLNAAPNRLLSGAGVDMLALGSAYGSAWFAPLGAVIAAVLAAWTWPERSTLQVAVLLAVATTLLALLSLAGWHAHQLDVRSEGLARTSLGSGFWLACAALWLLAGEALRQLRSPLLWKLLYWVLVLLAVAGLLNLGWLDSLSIMKEYAARSEDFWRALAQHLRIILITVVLTLCTGVPLGVWAQRRPVWSRRLFPLLGMVQTIPSIAMFSVLMALLAGLGKVFTVLPRWGIQGVGLAPAVLALALYSLLPLVRSIYAGLEQIPAAVRDAARGMGLSPWQLLLHIELPLALPVVLSGLKVMLVQTIGLTAVAALIGAGGLGSLMFEGLFSSALDLVVLAVVPIVALAWLAEALFMVLGLLTRRRMQKVLS